MNKIKYFSWLLLTFAFSILLNCTKHHDLAPETKNQVVPQVHRFNPEARNSLEAQKAPYVVLVSLDGFRFDYAKKYNAKNILDLAQNGVEAEALIPIFPSKTFPNHYSIVTGLYSDEHGIVSNEFYEPNLKDNYTMSWKKSSQSKWYQGEPLWVTAQNNGHLSASYFWVASEAKIQNKYPNWFVEFDEDISSQERIRQTIEWLSLPEDQRPHFITMYFSDTDHAGHDYGPESKEVSKAVNYVDTAIGQLREQLKQLNLPINLIVVSDHGMETLDLNKIITVDSVDLSAFKINGTGTMMKLYLNEGQPKEKIDIAIEALKKLNQPMRVWKREEMEKYHYSKMERVGDIILEADSPYLVLQKRPSQLELLGNHGWDPALFPNVRGIFYAEGPNFKSNFKIPAFENIHIYPLIAKILGYTNLPKISGRLEVLEPALNEAGSRQKK